MAEPSPPSFTPARNDPERRLPTTALAIAGSLIAVVLGLLVAFNGHRGKGNPNQALPAAPDAASLAFSQLEMSESTSLSGGKSTFLDGHIANHGTQTVTGVTVQVFFRNDEGMPPHHREFRLIFESIPGNWNTRMPEIRVVQVTTR